MDKHTKFIPPSRPLYSLDAAAVAAGLTVKLLLSAIENGDIPGVRILQLGPRKMRYIRSHPFAAWLEGADAPADPGPAADHAAEYAVAAKFDPTEYPDELFQ